MIIQTVIYNPLAYPFISSITQFHSSKSRSLQSRLEKNRVRLRIHTKYNLQLKKQGKNIPSKQRNFHVFRLLLGFEDPVRIDENQTCK